MTIAVHISSGREDDPSENFSLLFFSELAASQPDVHFIFIFDFSPDPEIYLKKNCTPVILLPIVRNNLQRHYWFNFKLPSVIERYNADLFITVGASCSFRITVPQFLVLRNSDIFLGGSNLYYKKLLPAFLKKARHVFTLEREAKQVLESKHNLPEAKITLLHPGIKNINEPVGYEQKQETKDRFAGGNEYFLFDGSGSDVGIVKIVLKAFSIFKKWQKSSMVMILLIEKEFEATIRKELSLYKFRSDVVLCISYTERNDLVGSAYAVIIQNARLFRNVLPAMKSGVPVIVQDNEKARYMEGVITSPWQDTALAEKLNNLYKNEHLRNEIISKAQEAVAKYSWNDTTRKIWQTIQNIGNS